MSVLLKEEIWNYYNEGKIVIEPFNGDQLGPNSYDVKLDSLLKIYTDPILDVKNKNSTKTIQIPKEGLVLQPGMLYLGSTIESAGSDYFIPMYEGKSSIARLGIESHLSAGFGDISFKSTWTLEITVVHKTRIYPGMKIGQVYFHNVNQKYNIPKNRYNGKYKNQVGPQESKSYLEYS